MLEDRRLLAVDLPPLLDINTKARSKLIHHRKISSMSAHSFLHRYDGDIGVRTLKSDVTDAGTVMGQGY